MSALHWSTAQHMIAPEYSSDFQTVLLDTIPLVGHLYTQNVQYLYGLLLMNTGILNSWQILWSLWCQLAFLSCSETAVNKYTYTILHICFPTFVVLFLVVVGDKIIYLASITLTHTNRCWWAPLHIIFLHCNHSPASQHSHSLHRVKAGIFWCKKL